MKVMKAINIIVLSSLFVIAGCKKAETKSAEEDTAIPVNVELKILNAFLNDSTVQKIMKYGGDNVKIVDMNHFLPYDTTTNVKLDNFNLQVIPSQDRILFLSGQKEENDYYKVITIQYNNDGKNMVFEGNFGNKNGIVQLRDSVRVYEHIMK